MLSVILVIIAFLTFGLCLSALLFSSINFRSKITKIILYTVTSLVIGFSFVRLIVWENEVSLSLWNDGKCSNCGEELRFVNASRYKFNTYYYYTCDNCGNTVELCFNPQGGN